MRNSSSSCRLIREAYDLCLLERPHVIGVLASYLEPDEAVSLLDSLFHAVPPSSDSGRRVLHAIWRYASPDRWMAVTRRFEDEMPNSLLTLPRRAAPELLETAVRDLDAAVPVRRIEIPASP